MRRSRESEMKCFHKRIKRAGFKIINKQLLRKLSERAKICHYLKLTGKFWTYLIRMGRDKVMKMAAVGQFNNFSTIIRF